MKQRNDLNNTRHSKGARIFALFVALLLFLFSGCTKKAGDGEFDPSKLSSYEHGRIATFNGALTDIVANREFPEAEIVYLNIMDAIAAFKADNIDGMVLTEDFGLALRAAIPSITNVPDVLDTADVSYCFPKNGQSDALCAELNEFLSLLRKDGTLDNLAAKWISLDYETAETEPVPESSGSRGTVTLGTNTQTPPYSFIRDNKIVGFDLEIIRRFCAEYDYTLNIVDTTFDGMIAGVTTGKFDFGCAGVQVNDERRASLTFSDPYYVTPMYMYCVDKSADSAGENFFDSVKNSFVKNFITEARWKLILEGIGRTIHITVLSALFGTLFGYFVYNSTRNGNKLAIKLSNLYSYLISGMPVVLFLMILYYVVFMKSRLRGSTVAIIGFTLVFGASVFALLKMGVSAIDKGQTEGAYALGYTNRLAFHKIVLPQALGIVMPSYRAEIRSLLKATAVVGYITVQDLTKMSDIIRSRTYEAFFPLIATAILYFLIAALLLFVLSLIEKRILPRDKTKEEIMRWMEQ